MTDDHENLALEHFQLYGMYIIVTCRSQVEEMLSKNKQMSDEFDRAKSEVNNLKMVNETLQSKVDQLESELKLKTDVSSQY